jgi:hypothetical protein
MRNKGILIGGAQQILLHVKRAEREVDAYFRNYLQLPTDGTIAINTSIKRCMLNGVLYSINDNVVVRRDDDPEGTPWKAKIKEFIVHRSNDTVTVHFAALYYTHVQHWDSRLGRRTEVIDEVIGMNMIEKNVEYQFDRDNIKPLYLLQHKFMAIDVDHHRAVAYEIHQAMQCDICLDSLFRNTFR